MNLATQLKRGYWAAITAVLLCLTIFNASEPPAQAAQPASIASLIQNEALCTAPIKSSWRFASTPLDVPPSLLHKTPICRA
jgi:hypothetical protein